MSVFSSRNRNPFRLPARLAALVLCLAAVLPALGSPARAADSPEAAIEKLSAWNVMRGYPDGQYYPERNITRAEFVALVNRAYGHTQAGPIPFTDVSSDAWYADDIAIAYNAGYFTGTSSTTASPEDSLSREQALVLLARNMRLEEVPGEVTAFTDGRDFAPYSKGYVNAAVRRGLINGFGDGTFRPQVPITRGQMAIMLTNAVGTLVPQSGTHVLGNVFGSLTLNRPDTTLKDTIVAGDLYISGGLGLGAVTLDNVQVLGDIVVAGGGDSEAGENSVVLRNVESDRLIVDSLNRQPLSLLAEGDTLIPKSNIRSSAFVQDQARSGFGLLDLTLDGTVPNTRYTLSGRLKDVWNLSPSSSLTISKGSADSLTIDEKALGSQLTVDTGTTVKELNLDLGIPISGTGDVSQLNVNAAGASSTILPDKIQVRPGLTASIAGEVMDTKLAEESSADPRLLAGYPEARSIAPTSLTAVFSGNKSGTVYWALSAITDGSIGEDDLITPPTYNSKAVKSGNVKLTASNTEMPVNVSGLTSGGSYYLSAVMTDARGTRSPLKVISLTTPDNTTPAFASGYPRISRLKTNADRTASAQIAVMATKTCDFYYAVMPKGASAPTVNDFKTAYVPGNKGFGVQKLTKNSAQYVTVSDSLTELTDYDLYLWLTDADGAKSSAIKKLSFKTPDGTPPEFRPHPSTPIEDTRTLTYSCGVTENCTVYWTAVRSGADYPKSPSNGGVLTPSYAQQVIISGSMGSPERSGKLTAKANQGVSLKITGLRPATAYDIYYVAVDPAGNISPVNLAARVGSFMVPGHTVDNEPPTVTQEFGYYSGGLPYVRLIFSEDVRQKTIKQSAVSSLQQLYNDVTGAQTTAQAAAARETLASALRATITLYNAATGEAMPNRTKDDQAAGTWVIDYRNATVQTNSDGTVTLQFAATSDAVKDSALNLSSGGSYFFRLAELEDTSSNHNPLVPARQDYVQTPNFTTSRATVTLINNNGEGKKIRVGSYDIESDVHFILDPNATSAADSSTAWDMLIWNNHALDYELYRKTPYSGGAWELVTNRSGLSVQSSNKGGKSLNGNFLGAAQPGTLPGGVPEDATSSSVWGLTDQGGAQYEYVIHVVSIDGNPDRASWAFQSDPVVFEVAVVAGSSEGIQAIGGNASKQNYEKVMKEYAGDLYKLSVLKNGDAERPFTVTVRFRSDLLPHFHDTYPRINPIRQTVSFNYSLDRAADIYYWIVPLPNEDAGLKTFILPQTIAHEDNIFFASTASKANRTFPSTNYSTFYNNIPTEGKIKDKTYENFAGTHYAYYPLEKPSAYDLQNDPRINASSEEYDYYITGKIPSSSYGTATITAPTGKRLLPNTDYIMYVVLESDDEMTSIPQAFRFKSDRLARPAVSLSRPVLSSAGIQNLGREKTDKINLYCGLVLADATSEAGALLNETIYWVAKDTNRYFPGTTKTQMTVLDALTGSHYSGGKKIGSLFDAWVDNEGTDSANAQKYLEGLSKMVHSGTGDYTMGGVIKNYPRSLGPGGYTTVECYNDMTQVMKYYFVCMAKNADDVSDSNAAASFNAYSTLSRPNEKTPMVQSVSVSIDRKKSTRTGGLCGTVTLGLNVHLFYTDGQDRWPVDMTLNGTTKSPSSTEIKSIGLGQLFHRGNNYLLPVYAATGGSAVQYLTFQFGAQDDKTKPVTECTDRIILSPLSDGGGFTIEKGNATNAFSLVLDFNIQSTVADGKTRWTATASVTTNDPVNHPYEWGKDQSGSDFVDFDPSIPVEELILDPPPTMGKTYELTVGESITLKASVVPANAGNQAVTWKCNDAGKDKISLSINGAECTITAVKEDTMNQTKVTVTALGSEDPDNQPVTQTIEFRIKSKPAGS